MSPFCDLGRQRKSAGQESEETDQYTAKDSDAGDGELETDRVRGRPRWRRGRQNCRRNGGATVMRTWMEKMRSGPVPEIGLRSRQS